MADKTPQGDVPEGVRVHLEQSAPAAQPVTLTASTADGVMTLICSDEGPLQGVIPVLDGNGDVLAVYTAGPAPTPQTRMDGMTRALTGSLGASTASDGAARLTYSRNWLDEQVEATEYKVTVSPGDALSFGASHVTQR
ncbi:hypothetical protein ABZ766_31975 [Streptomyces sp. NPDC006670]|uniref:hypothetical protein n=1 Tax=Streptomyces sp. NPDC006670 TaxID=3154476 RepID=UPI00340E5F52